MCRPPTSNIGKADRTLRGDGHRHRDRHEARQRERHQDFHGAERCGWIRAESTSDSAIGVRDAPNRSRLTANRAVSLCPAWAAARRVRGRMTLLSTLVATSAQVADTRARSIKTRLLADCLRALDVEEL